MKKPTVEFYQMLLRVVSKICVEFQQIILEYLHSVARNAKSFLFNLCDRNALSYHKSGYFRTITVLMHPFLQNWIDTKFAGYIEFFDKILEFLEKSLSFRDFLEFFRPWVFRFQRKRKPGLVACQKNGATFALNQIGKKVPKMLCVWFFWSSHYMFTGSCCLVPQFSKWSNK